MMAGPIDNEVRPIDPLVEYQQAEWSFEPELRRLNDLLERLVAIMERREAKEHHSPHDDDCCLVGSPCERHRHKLEEVGSDDVKCGCDGEEWHKKGPKCP